MPHQPLVHSPFVLKTAVARAIAFATIGLSASGGLSACGGGGAVNPGNEPPANSRVEAVVPGTAPEGANPQQPTQPGTEAQVAATGHSVDSRPPLMHRPVPLYEHGTSTAQVDAANARDEGYIVLDLGEAWTPYIFTERGNEDEPIIANSYRQTYLALARGEFPDDHHGRRARRDKYLELYGITPTLNLLRTRQQTLAAKECVQNQDLAPIIAFDGFIQFEGDSQGKTAARTFADTERFVTRLAESHHTTIEGLSEVRLNDRENRKVAEYNRYAPRISAIRAVQQRLECEGYMEGKAPFVAGAMDNSTHEALAEFEKRHRIFGWGYLGGETLTNLKIPTLELERRDLVRVLTERAVQAAGVIEDGSVTGTNRYRGTDGQEHDVPNLEEQIRDILVAAFNVGTIESAQAFLASLQELPAGQNRMVAIRSPELPFYYDGNMELSVETDRGDVWYDFPYDENGNERAQGIDRRPRVTIFTTFNRQKIPLARFGTTIGGWRSEVVNGSTYWKYKGSPVGEVVWHQVVGAPVWIPPESTPLGEIMERDGRGGWTVKYAEMGPSYASAYGLVAAYHIGFVRRNDGTYRLGGDFGIRTHGSVNYMSIMRRHSHGCHRLHNHLAVRLMSFVLAHRPHRRLGQQEIDFRRYLEQDGRTYTMELNRGGYVFQLERPIHDNVLEGRIRGTRQTPITHPIPKYDRTRAGYFLADGRQVRVSSSGAITDLNGAPVTALPALSDAPAP